LTLARLLASGILMRTLEGKIALVTGGTGALGRAVSAAFVAAGARVVATYVAEGEIPAFRAGLPQEGYELARVDLRSASEIADLVRRLLAAHGRIDVLVNLAGGFWGGVPLTETPEVELDRLVAMNLKTAFLCAQAVVPTMLRQRTGCIINVAARPALVGGAGLSAYAIAKAGVVALTRVLADELREHGVTVNAVAPSTIDTPANRAAIPEADPSRWVKPEEIAATMVFLASDAAVATSGAIVPIYGRS
jgi:NAD(P)-dependent dehydrogenase (short-subunit alcohol dehydrogenase family)